MEKLISCSVFYTDKKKFLAVHPTNSDEEYWDLPKGINERTETFEQTAVREFAEEVGIILNPLELRYMCKTSLYENKDIIIYSYIVPELAPLSLMKCYSKVKEFDKTFTEIDKYTYINIQEFYKLRKELHKCCITIMDRLNLN